MIMWILFLRSSRHSAYISVNEMDIDFSDLEELSVRTVIAKVTDVLDDMGVFEYDDELAERFSLLKG